MVFYCYLISDLTAQNQHFVKVNNFPDKPVHQIVVDNQNDKWLATEIGLLKMQVTSPNTYQSESLWQESAVSAVVIDAKQSKCIGTYHNYFLDQIENKFVRHNLANEDGFFISCLTSESDGSRWVGTMGKGLWQVSAEGEVKQHQANNSPLLSNDINAVLCDANETIWIGTTRGLNKIAKGKKWGSPLSLRQSTAIAQAENGIVVAGANEEGNTELWYYENYKHWRMLPIPSVLEDSRIADLEFDLNGVLWIASDVIVALNIADNSSQVYTHQEGFESSYAICLAVDKMNNVWVGTEGKGVFLLLRQKFEALTAETKEIMAANLATLKVDDFLASEKTDASWLNMAFKLNIQFERGKSDILDEALPEIDKLAELMVKFPTLQIEVAGHTDNVGDADKNIYLSRLRSEAIKKYLIEKKPQHITVARIRTIGHGGNKPIADNSKENTRALNRRVEVRFIKLD